LRDRKSDIPLLLEKFLERFCVSKKRVITGVDDEVLECLKRYQWPGNVRELENMVERMVILAAGPVITMEDLPPQLLNAPPPTSSQAMAEIPETDFCLSDVVADFERKLIVRALEQTGWVKNRAAKLLKVNRTTLLEKMKRHGVDKLAAG
jgi:DNA-binding NtrC family response regulator